MSEIKGILYNTDINTLLVFNKSIKCRFLDKVMPYLTNLGSAGVTISFCVLLIAAGDRTVRTAGCKALAVLTISHLIVRLLKNRVCRLRPKDVLEDINTFDLSLDYYSFPSGHTTAAFSIAMAVSVTFPVLAAVCFPIAFIVAVSRLYLGVHYPSDVLAGMAVAVFTSVMLQIVMKSLM